jgi:hypothetical protein
MLYQPIRSEATISILHILKYHASNAREKKKSEMVEQQLSGAFLKRFRKRSVFVPH